MSLPARVRSDGLYPVDVSVCLRFRADFADIFELCGMSRTDLRRGALDR